MKYKEETTGNPEETLDLEVKEALESFRRSIHAWSDAASSRARQPLAESHRPRVWRLVVASALGCALVAGSISTGVYRHHEKQAKIAEAQRSAEQQRQMAAAQAREEEELLAHVDSDVSQQVPSAMEPLAQLMTDDETR